MNNKQIKILSISSIVLSLFTIGFVATKLTFAAITDGHFVHSCVKNSNGSVRIVEANDTCNGNETALKWNSDGVDDFGGFVTKDLSGFDFSNQDLRYRNFKGVKFSDTSFNQAKISNSNFKNANFSAVLMSSLISSNTDFSNSNFTDVNFDNSNFDNSNFTGATILRTGGGSPSFLNVNFTNAHFINSDLYTFLSMNTTILTGATWSNTRCPDGTNSDNNGNTCEGHLVP